MSRQQERRGVGDAGDDRAVDHVERRHRARAVDTADLYAAGRTGEHQGATGAVGIAADVDDIRADDVRAGAEAQGLDGGALIRALPNVERTGDDRSRGVGELQGRAGRGTTGAVDVGVTDAEHAGCPEVDGERGQAAEIGGGGAGVGAARGAADLEGASVVVVHEAAAARQRQQRGGAGGDVGSDRHGTRDGQGLARPDEDLVGGGRAVRLRQEGSDGLVERAEVQHPGGRAGAHPDGGLGREEILARDAEDSRVHLGLAGIG